MDLELLRVTPDTVTDEAVSRIVELLRRGCLVVIPTDTVYGVAAHPDVPGAQQSLYQAKRRDAAKQIPFLVSGVDAAVRRGAALNSLERRIADAFWPGGLTIVLRVGERSEAFRVPDDPVALRVLQTAGGALRVSSANLSGDPPALTAAQAVQALGSSIAGVLDAGPVRGGVASTVVRVESRRIHILREGAVPANKLQRIADTQRAD